MIRVFNNLCSFFEDLLPMSFANLMNLSGQILKHHGTVLPDDTVIVLFEVMEKLKGRSERICRESINIVTKYLGNLPWPYIDPTIVLRKSKKIIFFMFFGPPKLILVRISL